MRRKKREFSRKILILLNVVVKKYTVYVYGEVLDGGVAGNDESSVTLVWGGVYHIISSYLPIN